MDFFAATGVSDYCPESDLSDPLVKVPLRFESSQKYIEVFQPLLLEEFQAQLQRSYGELSLSDGMTTGTMRLMSLERVDDFQLGRFMAEGGADGAARACSENDLLLLTRQPLCLGEPQSCHMLAKVIISQCPPQPPTLYWAMSDCCSFQPCVGNFLC
jgi:senataxin